MFELNAVCGRVYAFEITSNITAMRCTKIFVGGIVNVSVRLTSDFQAKNSARTKPSLEGGWHDEVVTEG